MEIKSNENLWVGLCKLQSRIHSPNIISWLSQITQSFTSFLCAIHVVVNFDFSFSNQQSEIWQLKRESFFYIGIDRNWIRLLDSLSCAQIFIQWTTFVKIQNKLFCSVILKIQEEELYHVENEWRAKHCSNNNVRLPPHHRSRHEIHW